MKIRELAVLGVVVALVSAPAIARAADAGPPGCFAAGAPCNTSGTDNSCCSGMCTPFGMCAEIPDDAGCVPSGASCTPRSNCCDTTQVCLIEQTCGPRPPPPVDPVQGDDGGASSSGSSGASSSGSSGASSSGTSGASGTSGTSGALPGGSSASGCACTTVDRASPASLTGAAGGALAFLGLAMLFTRRRR
jgi:MYXO-CTERM domain-containing protein